MPSPHTKNLEFKGFDSSEFSAFRAGFSLGAGQFPSLFDSEFLVVWILSMRIGWGSGRQPTGSLTIAGLRALAMGICI